MHLEETLQLSLDEKEDIIKALQTQVCKIFVSNYLVSKSHSKALSQYTHFLMNSKLKSFQSYAVHV